MKIRRLIVFLLFTLSIICATPVTMTKMPKITLQLDFPLNGYLTQIQLENKDGVPPLPGPDLGVANWTSNRLQNPDFEDWSTLDDCDGWVEEESSNDRFQWVATAPWPVSNGTRSAGMQCRSPSGFTEETEIFQHSLGADMSNLTLVFDWYLHQNMDPTHDYFYLELILLNGSYRYWLFYYLNSSVSMPTNETFSASFRIRAPANQWNTFSRNLTADFLAVGTFPDQIGPLLEVDEIHFRLKYFGGTDQYLRSFIDDVILEDESYSWIRGSQGNGNFETGSFSPWNLLDNTDAAFVRQSSTAYLNSWSANLTANSLGNSSRAYFYDTPDVRITSQNKGTIKFWWYLSYHNSTEHSISYLDMFYYDGIDWYNIYYMLGYGSTVCPFTNGSHLLVLHAENFNTTESWVLCQHNIWNDASSYFASDELFIRFWGIRTETQGSNSRLVTLIDSALLRAAAINGAGYEDQPDVGQRIHGWTSSPSTFTVTSSGYAGSKAANLTLLSGRTFSNQQYLQWRPLNNSRETYLDVIWRLEDTVANNKVWFRLIMTDGRELNYYMNGLTPGLNTSTATHFNVTSAGTTGVWNQMHRDLAHDYEARFGSLLDIAMERIYLRADTNGGNRLEIVFDDLYIYDDPAPRLSNVNQNPSTPDHLEVVQVSANAVDQDLDKVVLHYRINSGTWENLSMLYQSGDTYNATIPGQVHNTIIEYFVTANDTWGMTTTALDNGGYWSYTAMDQTYPSIDSVIQTPTVVTPSDSVNVSVIVTETGSGLASVVLNYSINSGTWQIVIMQTTGSSGGYYEFIPAQTVDTLVEYYINATDNAGLITIDDNNTNYYSYIVGDNTIPVISNVDRTPTSVNYTDSPLVGCDVTDTGSGVDVVRLYYQVNGGGFVNILLMAEGPSDHYTATIPSQNYNFLVEYYINASDVAGNFAVADNNGNYYNYTVEDTTGPLISNVDRTPTDVEYTDSPIIGCNVTDPGSDVAEVVLYYQLNSSGTWIPLIMATTGDGHYTITIPNQPYNSIVAYYINATDYANNWVTDPLVGNYSYPVQDHTTPLIDDVSHYPSAVTTTDTPLVNCTATDLGSGINTVTLHYRINSGSWTQVTMTPALGSTYETTLSPLPWGTLVEYYVSATDGAANLALNNNSGLYYWYTVGDITPPNIANTGQSPLSVEYSDNVLVGCDVTDLGSGVHTALLYYNLSGSEWTCLVMTPTGNHYEATIPVQPWGISIEYYIFANDTAGNSAVDNNGGINYIYTVVDTIDPQISNVSHTPTIVEYSDSATIGCNVLEPGSGIDTVVLAYRIDGSSWTYLTMTVSVGSHFEVTIPPQVWGTLVEYWINASDGAGNWVVDNNSGGFYTYTVRDATNPTIEITTPSTDAEVNGTISIGIVASDAGSGISRVEIYIDGNTIATLTTSPFNYNWTTTLESNGAHTIMTVAYDSAGNSASDSVSVNVNNAYTTTLIEPIPGFPYIAIGLALIIGISIGLIRRRRHR